MDDWGGLENRCSPLGYREFESHPLRQTALASRAFLFDPGSSSFLEYAARDLKELRELPYTRRCVMQTTRAKLERLDDEG